MPQIPRLTNQNLTVILMPSFCDCKCVRYNCSLEIFNSTALLVNIYLHILTYMTQTSEYNFDIGKYMRVVWESNILINHTVVLLGYLWHDLCKYGAPPFLSSLALCMLTEFNKSGDLSFLKLKSCSELD